MKTRNVYQYCVFSEQPILEEAVYFKSHCFFIIKRGAYESVLSFFTIIVLVGLDQLFKYFATLFLMPVKSVLIIPGVVGLRYVLNDGAAFSLFSGSRVMLIVVTVIALLLLAYWIFTKKYETKLEHCALLLIFSGGVGNLINRIASGLVVDYIEPLFINFAVFNFADILVCVGVALFALSIILQELRKKKHEVI